MPALVLQPWHGRLQDAREGGAPGSAAVARFRQGRSGCTAPAGRRRAEAPGLGGWVGARSSGGGNAALALGPSGSVDSVPRRNLIPFTLLAVLVILALVFAVIGQTSSPNRASLAVQNATSATFGDPAGSNSFTMNLSASLSASLHSSSFRRTAHHLQPRPGH